MDAKDLLLEEDSLRSLLEEMGVEIEGETSTDLICFCPLHTNRDTPAFNMAKFEPAHPWRCWSPGCARSGTLPSLVGEVLHLSPINTFRKIRAYRPTVAPKVQKVEIREYAVLDSDILQNLDTDITKLNYMLDRGYSEHTLRDFGVGFEDDFIVVPVWDESKNLVGFTCRSTKVGMKKYMDTGLPKRFLLFNMHNALNYDEVIIVEGPLDAMKVHQAGFPNVVSTMMGDFTKWQQDWVRKSFKSCIIFTDADEPGRKLGVVIAERLKGLRLYWASYPSGYKDPGELPLEDIQIAIQNKIPNIVYQIKNNLGDR